MGPAFECNLKYQNLTSSSLASIAVWNQGSATTFSSGNIPLLFDPTLLPLMQASHCCIFQSCLKAMSARSALRKILVESNNLALITLHQMRHYLTWKSFLSKQKPSAGQTGALNPFPALGSQSGNPMSAPP